MQMNDETRARYSVIFLSDGQPTNNQDDELLCGDAVRRIRQLKDLADDVKVNTVHVFIPTQPLASTACMLRRGRQHSHRREHLRHSRPAARARARLLIVNQNAERLSAHGRPGRRRLPRLPQQRADQLPELPLRAGAAHLHLRQAGGLELLGARGQPARCRRHRLRRPDGRQTSSTRARCPGWRTPTATASPTASRSTSARAAACSPPTRCRCPMAAASTPVARWSCAAWTPTATRLTDCDEQIIGTNAQRVDSDDDGISDAVEFKLGSQPSSKDLTQDPDNDRLPTGDELTMHMNPLQGRLRQPVGDRLPLRGGEVRRARSGGPAVLELPHQQRGAGEHHGRHPRRRETPTAAPICRAWARASTTSSCRTR